MENYASKPLITINCCGGVTKKNRKYWNKYKYKAYISKPKAICKELGKNEKRKITLSIRK